MAVIVRGRRCSNSTDFQYLKLERRSLPSFGFGSQLHGQQNLVSNSSSSGPHSVGNLPRGMPGARVISILRVRIRRDRFAKTYLVVHRICILWDSLEMLLLLNLRRRPLTIVPVANWLLCLVLGYRLGLLLRLGVYDLLPRA